MECEALKSEDFLAFNRVQPIGGVGLIRKGLLREHANSNRIQHTRDKFALIELAAWSSSYQPGSPPYLLTLQRVGDGQSDILPVDEFDTVVQGDFEHPWVENQPYRQGGSKAENRPNQSGVFDQIFTLNFVFRVMLNGLWFVMNVAWWRFMLCFPVHMQR